MGTQLDLFPETLEALCGQPGAAPETATQAELPESTLQTRPDAVTSPADAFAAMGRPSDQRYLPLHLLHSGTRTYH